jgi:chromate transport protein ChrA
MIGLFAVFRQSKAIPGPESQLIAEYSGREVNATGSVHLK